VKHIFRINTSGSGTTLLTCEHPQNHDSFLRLEEHDLDRISPGITSNFLSSQSHLDNMLNLATRWCLCISYQNRIERPIVAYGNLFKTLQDETGRSGIHFIHAIEVEDTIQIVHAVKSIIGALSKQSLTTLTRLISEVAWGQSTPEFLTKHLVGQFQIVKLRPTSTSETPLKAVEHDCGGASSAAWLAMAVSHINCTPPWEIYDRAPSSSANIETVSTCHHAEKRVSLSSYLYQITTSEPFQEAQKPISDNSSTKFNPQSPRTHELERAPVTQPSNQHTRSTEETGIQKKQPTAREEGWGEHSPRTHSPRQQGQQGTRPNKVEERLDTETSYNDPQSPRPHESERAPVTQPSNQHTRSTGETGIQKKQPTAREEGWGEHSPRTHSPRQQGQQGTRPNKVEEDQGMINGTSIFVAILVMLVILMIMLFIT